MTVVKDGYLYQTQDYSSSTPFSIAIFRSFQFNNIKLAKSKKRGNSKYLDRYKNYLPEGTIVPDDKSRLFLPSSVRKELQIEVDDPKRWWLGYHGGAGNITNIFLLPDLGADTYFNAKEKYEDSHPGFPKSLRLYRYGVTIKSEAYPEGTMNHKGFNNMDIWPEPVRLQVKDYPERLFFKLPDVFNRLYRNEVRFEDALDVPFTYEEIKEKKDFIKKWFPESYKLKAPDRPAFLFFYDSCRNLIFERVEYGSFSKKQYEDKYKHFYLNNS